MKSRNVGRVGLVALFLLMVGSANGADLIPPLAKIQRGHPRIFLRPKDTPYAISLGRLKALPRDADFKKVLTRLRRQKNAASRAMVWLLTGDPVAADNAIARMRHYDNPTGKGSAFTVYFKLREFALAYDWLHGYKGFTPSVRKQIRGNVAPLVATGMKISDDHLFHNYVWMSAGGIGLWALATAGEDAAADRLYARIRDRFNRRLYPAWRYLDGLPSEPMGYWALYVFSPGVLMLLGAQSASEADLVAAVRKDGDWLARHFENLVHSVLPNLRYIPWGDLQRGADGGVTHEMAGVIDALTWALRSPHGAFLGRRIARRRGLARFYGETAIFYFLYTRQLGVKPKTPPLSFFAGGRQGGHFIARSSWRDDATIVAFTCTDHFGSHHHFDQGSFTIYRRGLLAVDPPVYKRPRGPQQPTDVHNTLLLGGRGQRAVRGQWFKTLAEFRKNLTGGRRLETGDILFHADAGPWAAVAGQFAQAYSDGLVRSCVRQLLFVRPGTVIVVDHLVPPEGKELPEVRWLLQLPAEPRVRFGLVSVESEASHLRCRPLFPGASVPKVERTRVGTYRVGYTYKGSSGLSLVHEVRVGRLRGGRAPEVKVKRTREGIELTLGGRTYVFADQPPFGVKCR